jgi:hypothetical protein
MKRLLIYSLAIATIAWSLSFAFISPVSAASINNGDVIKLATSPAVYYVTGGKKMLMPNRGVYSSWSSAIGDQNDKFATLRVVSDTDFGSLPFGPNMTVRPGTGLVKFTDSNDLFAIGYDNKLYKLYNENTKNVLYPNATIITLTESFRSNYYEYGNSVAVLTANSTYPDGTLIKDTNQSVVYLVENGQRRFMTPDIFSSNGFKNQWIISTDIYKYQQGEDLKGQRDGVVVPFVGNQKFSSLSMNFEIEYPSDWRRMVGMKPDTDFHYSLSLGPSSILEDYIFIIMLVDKIPALGTVAGNSNQVIIKIEDTIFKGTLVKKVYTKNLSLNKEWSDIYVQYDGVILKIGQPTINNSDFPFDHKYNEQIEKILNSFSFITADPQDIIDAFKRKYPSRDYSSLTVTINKNHQDLFVQGSIFSVGDTGGVFWAAKVNGVWQIVFDGQDSPPCSTLNSYNFPDEMLSGCY